MKDLAETVSRMLRRLEATARAELTSIESIERRADEDRRLRWAVAIGFVSAVAIPISLILAFFGINADEVNPQRSMLDPSYTWVYAAVVALAALATLLALTLYVVQVRQHRKLLDARPRPPATLTHLPELPTQHQPGQT
jgi:Mg2+ and Co2+ transporter CorA